MKTWTTKNVTINEVPFNFSLHAFEVYNKDGELLGTITPGSIEDMNDCIASLDSGACPIADGWEDGNGNSCSLSGWGESGN